MYLGNLFMFIHHCFLQPICYLFIIVSYNLFCFCLIKLERPKPQQEIYLKVEVHELQRKSSRKRERERERENKETIWLRPTLNSLIITRRDAFFYSYSG